MGLDSVELLLDIEETFSIRIPDEVAASLRTAGDVFEYLTARIPAVETPRVCLTAATFYQLRRGAAELGVPGRLRPSTPTDSLAPAAERRRFWRRWSEVAELKLPELRRPTWVVVGCNAAVALAAAGAGSWAALNSSTVANGVGAFIFVGAVASFAGSWLQYVVTRPLATAPPRDGPTLGALAAATVRRNLPTLAARHSGASRDELWRMLRDLIVEQLGVAPEQVVPTARFVEDLGCD